MGGRREVFHEDKPLLQFASRLGQIFPLLEDGHLDELGGHLYYDLGGPLGVGSSIEGTEAGLNDGGRLGHASQVLGRLGGDQQRLEDDVVDSRAEASVVVLSLTDDNRKVKEAQSQRSELLLLLIRCVLLLLHLPLEDGQPVVVVSHIVLQIFHVLLDHADGVL